MNNHAQAKNQQIVIGIAFYHSCAAQGSTTLEYVLLNPHTSSLIVGWVCYRGLQYGYYLE
jgi:hypothetical protein